jgi:hypothetical protein
METLKLIDILATAVPLVFESGRLGAPCPNVGKSCLPVLQSLLKGNATDLIQTVQSDQLFPLSQHPGGLSVTDSFSSFVPSFCSQVQSAIADEANATQRAVQGLFLLGSRVETVSASSWNHTSFLHVICEKNTWRWRFLSR